MLGWFRVSGCFFFFQIFFGEYIFLPILKKGWFFILQTLTKYNTYRKFGIQNGGQGSVSKKIKKFVIVRAKTKKKKDRHKWTPIEFFRLLHQNQQKMSTKIGNKNVLTSPRGFPRQPPPPRSCFRVRN